MSTLRFAGFAGSWSQPSRTRALVAEAAARAVRRYGGSAAVFDIGDLGAGFAAARDGADVDAAFARLRDALIEADGVIVGSPVYKGSYTGLFKHFFDLIDPAALASKPILLTATGGGDKHALVIEHQLRPLFAFFEATTLPTGVYVSSAEFEGTTLAGEAASTRLDRAIEQFGPLLRVEPTRSLKAVG